MIKLIEGQMTGKINARSVCSLECRDMTSTYFRILEGFKSLPWKSFACDLSFFAKSS